MEKPHFTPNPVAKDEMEHEGGAPVSVVLHWPCLPDTRCCDYDDIDIVPGWLVLVPGGGPAPG